jgi:hypothetical protein
VFLCQPGGPVFFQKVKIEPPSLQVYFTKCRLTHASFVDAFENAESGGPAKSGSRPMDEKRHFAGLPRN